MDLENKNIEHQDTIFAISKFICVCVCVMADEAMLTSVLHNLLMI